MTETHEYQSLYRKWRPQRFADVVHQEYTVRTLQNAILSHQIAHAYLLAGPRGVGKTSIARIFAKAINCTNPQQGEPCNQCDMCKKITRGNALDVIEIDGASNRGIDQIRQLREEVNFVPAEAKYKVYIIDEVHMLTNEAFNALLKTLEEPPKHVVFLFATTEPHKVPLTILSRCQAFELKLLPPERIEKRLQEICEAEQINASPKVLTAIAHRARGALRDAIVMLEQLASYKGTARIEEHDLFEIMGLASEETVQEFLKALLTRQGRRALEIIADLAERGKDLELFVDELIEQTRDWIIAALDGQPVPTGAPLETLIGLSTQLLGLKRELGRAWEKRILLEVKAVELTHALPAPAQSPAPQSPVLVGESSSRRPEAKTTKEKSIKKALTAGPDPAPASATEQDKWAQVLEAVKRDRRGTVHALLLDGQPVELPDALRIEYDPQHAFHKESLEKHRKYLEEIVAQVYGPRRVEIAFAQTTGSATRRKSKSVELREKAELLKQAFDGEIL
uniref:DNA polymerase III subunit gamma/tau n=3 Tax=Candidatus Bipolaricaulota TaxID=67810 RepID=H5SLQ3_9BACT|nr:DNA polymerase III subunit gamma/tau [uncultured Acetothermia bacterium]BAL57089.1 DNA polymerase III subunit gamma/tau [uncultured Acetothermia bacterium]BAL58798.1 DNA polymerase III subunit gamma/tau [Candidatus Acetothermum autotrophicum]